MDAALKHAAVALEQSPGSQDVATLLVPELAKHGRVADAEALYRKAVVPYRTMVEEFPTSAFAHNGVAWVAACCRRDLNVALDHARKSLESPQCIAVRFFYI